MRDKLGTAQLLPRRRVRRHGFGRHRGARKTFNRTLPAPPTRAATRIRQRQRQRLIDACISALHIYGPSRTTVEKVVALADLSPGIVRFYFDSKAAMLVASLDHLAAEFEDRVTGPGRAAQGPRRSRRCVCWWSSTWMPISPAPAKSRCGTRSGERQARARSTYDICGKKDEDFAALVRELIAAPDRARPARHTWMPMAWPWA